MSGCTVLLPLYREYLLYQLKHLYRDFCLPPIFNRGCRRNLTFLVNDSGLIGLVEFYMLLLKYYWDKLLCYNVMFMIFTVTQRNNEPSWPKTNHLPIGCCMCCRCITIGYPTSPNVWWSWIFWGKQDVSSFPHFSSNNLKNLWRLLKGLVVPFIII